MAKQLLSIEKAWLLSQIGQPILIFLLYGNLQLHRSDNRL